MPTGYTAAIADGISFNDFILRCARMLAFGALILMRDDPNDKPIPEEFKLSDYHSKKIVETMKELKALESLSEKGADKRAEQDYQAALKDKKDGIEKTNKLRKKYTSMLIQVKTWIPPSPDHIGLKDFMIKQIEESIGFDCGTDYYTRQRIKPQSGKEWLAERNQMLLKDLAYYAEEDEKERERTAGRNRWIKQLRESLTKQEPQG